MLTQPEIDFETRFVALDEWLFCHNAFWQFKTFECLDLPWRTTHPALCEWLDALTPEQMAAYRASHLALVNEASQFIPSVALYDAFISLPALEFHPTYFDAKWHAGVPGRKWQQIQRFAEGVASKESDEAGVWLDWCSGKGYLGRLLAVKYGVTVHCLEWQQSLCEAGQAFADVHQLPMTYFQGDALDSAQAKKVANCEHVLALHACGDLHRQLLLLSAQEKPVRVSFSPCCYHLTCSANYEPLSKSAKTSRLHLSVFDLKLPLQETVTANKKTAALRQVEVSYRLGFDSLQRYLCGTSDYLPVPNVPKSFLNQDFHTFCVWAAEQKDITLPEGIDFSHWEAKGKERFWLVERIETLKTLFRRPLEIWLALDRALYLEESGYQVTLSTFCERALTPRNILISAVHRTE